MKLRAAPLLIALLAGAAACSNALPSATPRDAFRRAGEAMAAGEPRTARIELLNAIKAEPNNRAFRLLQAQVYLRLRDGPAAQAELERARQLGADRAGTAHLMAEALLMQGDARAALAEAARSAPAHAAAARRLEGRAWQAMGDPQRAADAFDAALVLAPRDSRLWSDIGRFRLGSGEIAGAIEAADRAVRLGPRNVEALTLRGELTRGQYGLAAALPWFDRALEADPEYLPALAERAATLGEVGSAQAMLADTRRMLALSPGNPTAYYLQAALAARGRDYDLARALYARAARGYDGTPGGMLLSGSILLATGAPTQAAQRLQRLLDLQPANLKARRLLGAALWKSGDAAGTIAVLGPIAERMDADAYSLSVIARAYAKLGDRAAAARTLSRAAAPRLAAGAPLADPIGDGDFARLRREADARPLDGVAQVGLIRALLGRGLGAEAVERSQRLRARNPGAPDGYVLLGDALAISGDYRGAAAAYRGAANLTFTEPVALRLIEALRNAGDRRGAAQVLGLFLAQNPGNMTAQLMAANACLEAQQWSRAAALYESVRARLGNGDATLLNNLAWAYLKLGDYERALPLARHAYALDRRNPATADTLGWILYRSGEAKAEGLALLQQAARGG